MAACLPEQFWVIWVAWNTGAQPVLALGGAVGEVGAVLQGGGSEAVHGEDALGAAAVLGSAGVARGGQGQQVGGKVEAGADHGHGLQGLERGARVERRQRVAGRYQG